MSDFTYREFSQVVDTIGPVPRIMCSPEAFCGVPGGLFSMCCREDSGDSIYLTPDDAKTLTEKALDVFLEKNGIQQIYHDRDDSYGTWKVQWVDEKPVESLMGCAFPMEDDRFKIKLLFAKALKEATE